MNRPKSVLRYPDLTFFAGRVIFAAFSVIEAQNAEIRNSATPGINAAIPVPPRYLRLMICMMPKNIPYTEIGTKAARSTQGSLLRKTSAILVSYTALGFSETSQSA